MRRVIKELRFMATGVGLWLAIGIAMFLLGGAMIGFDKLVVGDIGLRELPEQLGVFTIPYIIVRVVGLLVWGTGCLIWAFCIFSKHFWSMLDR